MVVGLKLQRRLASEVLGVGSGRIWLDPSKYKEIKEAITRADISSLIDKKFIIVKVITGQSRGRARSVRSKKAEGRRRGPGSKKGERGARAGFAWKEKVRALRRALYKQRESGKVDRKEFRVLYRKIKGNSFHSVSHMMNYIDESKKGKL
jgi:large subunit ribosomal protein L19e